MPARTQHHHQRQIHAPAKEPHRLGRRALAAHAAAKAEAPLEASAPLGRNTAWLARVVGAVKTAGTGTAAGLGQGCQFTIDLQQQGEETGVLLERVAHWDRL